MSNKFYFLHVFVSGQFKKLRSVKNFYSASNFKRIVIQVNIMTNKRAFQFQLLVMQTVFLFEAPEQIVLLFSNQYLVYLIIEQEMLIKWRHNVFGLQFLK